MISNLFIIAGILIFIVLIFLIYLSSTWILKKIRIGSDKSRKITGVVLSVLASPVFVVGIFIGMIILRDNLHYSYSYNYFDQYRWINTASSRKELAPFLIEERQLIGWTKQEVINFLDIPFHYYDENTIMYHLEIWPHCPVGNPEVLIIRFLGGKVIKVEIQNLYPGVNAS